MSNNTTCQKCGARLNYAIGSREWFRCETFCGEHGNIRQSERCEINCLKKKNAKLRAQIAALTMTWTSENPTVPGFYGYRHKTNYPGGIIEVDNSMMADLGISGCHFLKSLPGQFCGPIQLPT